MVWSQETQEESYKLINQQEGADIAFAYSVPSSPSLAIAGLKASDVTKLNEIRKFVASIPSALDGDGDTAIALDVRPGFFQ